MSRGKDGTGSPFPLPSAVSSSITGCIGMYSFILILLLTSDDARATSKHLNYVTCGSVIKLVNGNFMTKLHSHDVKYGSGSGQQSVTGTDDSDEGSSYWQVKGSTDGPCTRDRQSNVVTVSVSLIWGRERICIVTCSRHRCPASRRCPLSARTERGTRVTIGL